MIKNGYSIIGVMSGTSLDGIDLAYVTFAFQKNWTFKIIKAETIAYTEEWQTNLKHLVNFNKEDLLETDRNYTAYLSEVISGFILKYKISNIDAICSHGHTALHQPENGLTYQIGNLPLLVSRLKQTIVCDFRVQDVAFGGQGAPLVPIGDKFLFSDYDFCINLGGFANISFQENRERIAFDICPVNIVLNKYVSEFGFNYDDKGEIAKSGKIDNELLNALNSLQFYKEKHPKSLGLEWVKDVIFPLIDSYNISVKDILRTFVEHIAIQISKILNKNKDASVLITGGGVFNSFLLSRIEDLSDNKLIIPPKKIIEFKEALIFAFLGVLKLRGENNCLASVTGAKQDHSSGVIFQF